MATENAIIIREWQDADSFEELTALLHRAYKFLADRGLRYLATYQSVDVTKSRVRGGRCLVALDGNRLVGTLCYYSGGSYAECPWYERPGVAPMGQLGIEPSYQGQGIATRLIRSAEELAIREGKAELALDTAEPATWLIGWYERMGYRIVAHADWDVTNYRSVILSKRLSPQAEGDATRNGGRDL
jgi:GNAT superfamily N-acetyltransferase